jgi:CRP-like cAMP-binding protein
MKVTILWLGDRNKGTLPPVFLYRDTNSNIDSLLILNLIYITMEKYGLYDVVFKLKPMPKRLTDRQYVDELIAAIDQRLTETDHRHRSLLLNAGHTSDYMYFVGKGIARCFYFDDRSGKELTSILWKEQSIVCDPVSFFQRRASDVNIEVMPGSVLLSISYRQLQDIFRAFPEAEIFTRCISLQYVYYFAGRARQLAGSSAWERYLHLLSTHPGVELIISKEIIASYLNITPQSLSRMLRENGHP